MPMVALSSYILKRPQNLKKNSHLVLTLLTKCQNQVEYFFLNFLAFSEKKTSTLTKYFLSISGSMLFRRKGFDEVRRGQRRGQIKMPAIFCWLQKVQEILVRRLRWSKTS